MHPATRTTLTALLAAAACVTPALGEPLSVRKAAAAFRLRARDGALRHRLVLEGFLDSAAPVNAFDPEAHGLRVEVAGIAVVDVPAGSDPGGFRAVVRRGTLRKWRYRSRGEPGGSGRVRVTLDARTGRVVLRVHKADLSTLAQHGPQDVLAAVEVGTARDEQTFVFTVVRDRPPVRWRFPAPTPRDGPVPFTSIVAGSLAQTPRPAVEVARTDAELAALWVALGNPAELPSVDFTREMVVVLSTLIEGAGVWGPPAIQIDAARVSGGRLEIDWYLVGCEWGLCPGAPAPVQCAQDTPYHVLVTPRVGGTPLLNQGPLLGVCP